MRHDDRHKRLSVVGWVEPLRAPFREEKRKGLKPNASYHVFMITLNAFFIGLPSRNESYQLQ